MEAELSKYLNACITAKCQDFKGVFILWKDLTTSTHCWGCVRDATAGNSGGGAAEYSRMSEKLESISRWAFPCFTVNQALGFALSILRVVTKSFKLKHDACLSLLCGVDLWSMLTVLFWFACPHWAVFDTSPEPSGTQEEYLAWLLVQAKAAATANLSWSLWI